MLQHLLEVEQARHEEHDMAVSDGSATAAADGSGAPEEFSGKLSPLAPVPPWPQESLKAAGIPKEARSFCFAYPAEGMEEALETFNLAEEPWGFFLQIGGFCFFGAPDDADDVLDTLICTNALTLIPLPHIMQFEGPNEVDPVGLQELQSSQRMCDVTLDALEAQGFKAFGWIHAPQFSSESIKSIMKDTTMTNHHGGFVYQMHGAQPSFFRLAQHTRDQIDEFNSAFDHDEQPGSEPKGLLGRYKAWRATYARDRAKSRREEQKMREMTAMEADSLGSHRRGHLLLRRLFILGAAMFFILGGISLAYRHRGTFEFCATSVWFGCFTYTAWVPLRDTSALAVLATSRWRKLAMYSLLLFIPVATTALSAVAWLAETTAAIRDWMNLAIEVVGIILVYLVVPLTLYCLRRRAADDLERGRDAHVASEARQQLHAARFVGHLASSTTGDCRSSSPPPSPPEDDGETETRAPTVAAVPPSRSAACSAPRYTGGVVLSSGHMQLLRSPLPSMSSILSSSSPGRRSKRRVYPSGGAPVSAGAPTPLSRDWKSNSGDLVAPRRPLFGGLKGRLPSYRDLAPGGKSRRAVIKLQARARAWLARSRYRRELRKRQTALRRFSLPILIVSLIEIFGGTVIYEAVRRGRLPETYILYSVLCALPAFFTVFYDLRRDVPIRFSLTHCIFYVSVLYKLAFRASQIDSIVLRLVTDQLEKSFGYEDGSGSSVATTITMVCHFILFIFVTSLGKISLTLVSTKNACAHLLFPFQFFDFIFLYVFFSLRTVATRDATSWLFWIVQQCLLQGNIILRNSGTTDALIKRHLGRWIDSLLSKRKNLRRLNVDDDPLFRLQHLARIAIQYDLADVTALLLVPSVVSLFVWRDGWFSLEDSGVLVRACDLPLLWLRFCILLIIKPGASRLSQRILTRAMRKTLLGKETIHGRSAIAARILANQRIVKTEEDTDKELHKEFDLAVEELHLVAQDLSLSGLNFKLLRGKLLRKLHFYTAVVVLQCFAAFPVHANAPLGLAWDSQTRTYFTDSQVYVTVPKQSVWMYVPPAYYLAKDEALVEAFNRTGFLPGTCDATTYFIGWQL